MCLERKIIFRETREFFRSPVFYRRTSALIVDTTRNNIPEHLLNLLNRWWRCNGDTAFLHCRLHVVCICCFVFTAARPCRTKKNNVYDVSHRVIRWRTMNRLEKRSFVRLRPRSRGRFCATVRRVSFRKLRSVDKRSSQLGTELLPCYSTWIFAERRDTKEWSLKGLNDNEIWGDSTQ